MTPAQHESLMVRLRQLAMAMRDAACYSPPATADRLLRAAALVTEARYELLGRPPSDGGRP